MDIDDELQMLQRELMAVQQQKTNPLSERTVAQIMVKLYHEGFAFYPTTDGNEYVIPDQLDKQIANLVKQRGKINLNMIPQILNIGIDTIESRVNIVMQKHQITRHTNNLISHRYFDNLIANLRQRLELEGIVELEQVAIEHELNIKFIDKLVNDHIDTLQAELVGNQLITTEYTRLKKSKILGFLSALSNPINVDTFLKATGIENRNIEDILNELIQQGKLKGKYQNSYFVPDKFTVNQKRIITQFYQNNGYIDAESLQRKFLVSKPEEWIQKNIHSDYVKIQKMYFKAEKIESYSLQINSLLKSEGFMQLSHVLPMQFQDKTLHNFMEQYCKLKDYFICEGYVYSNEWLQKLANEFKQKIIHSIFFKKSEIKTKDNKKKNNKKIQKQEVLTEEDLKETLFNCGFADYSVAETLAPELLPLMLEKIELIKKQVEKELAHSKGFINSNFLKYRSCKTILRTQESLNRTVNIIQKQQKKGDKWNDNQFGPIQTDKTGMYSLLYYDNALPKGWPTLQTLKWIDTNPKHIIVPEINQKLTPSLKTSLPQLLQIVQYHNQVNLLKLAHPQLQPIKEEDEGPYIYQFFIAEREKRYVIVDAKLPFVEEKPFASYSRYSFAEKAYAKLRYCYKGIQGVGIQQLLLQITGRTSQKYVIDSEKQKDMMLIQLKEHLTHDDFVIVLAEGAADKKLIFQDRQTPFNSLTPYYIYLRDSQLQIYPKVTDEQTPLKLIVQLFRNIIVIPTVK